MIDKIIDIASSKVLNNVSESKNGNKAADTKESVSKATSSEDSVELSSTAKQLDSLKKAIDNTPEVDQDRVNAVKQALEAGELKIDSNALAKKMLEFESL